MMTVPYVIRHKLSLRPRTSTVCLCAQAAADTQERVFFVSVVTSVWMKDLRCSPDTFLEVVQISLCLLVVLVCDARGLGGCESGSLEPVDIGLDLSLPVGSPPAGPLWRFRDLNVHHKTRPFMCDHTIVPPRTKSSL